MYFYKLCIFLSYLPAALDATKFTWPVYDRRFDFVVGITVHSKPVSIGSWISYKIIVTSANPLESYLTKGGKTSFEDYSYGTGIEIKYNNRNLWAGKRRYFIVGMHTNISNRNKTWIRMGFSKTHSPIHDLMFIQMLYQDPPTKQSNVKDPLRPPILYLGRPPFEPSDLARHFRYGWTFASFGHVDADHVKNGTILEVSQYEDDDEEDCDEWIPRAWGRFICFANFENLVAIQSGAPLMHNGQLRGIGSFALKKGKESILVFTDFSLYREYMKTILTPWLLKADFEHEWHYDEYKKLI